MEDAEQKLQRLIKARDWTPEDKRWLLAYLESSDDSALQAMMLREFKSRLSEDATGWESSSATLLNSIHNRLGLTPQAVPMRAWWRRLAAACVVALVTACSLFIWLGNRHPATPKNLTHINTRAPLDVPPGSSRATLTLADGSVILLDEADNGSLARQGATTVQKYKGKLAYKPGPDGAAAVMYNTISTPRGGQYEVVLPDGSTVWLNSASSIRFPTVFTGNQRRVDISGEAYFEVAKNARSPFIVGLGQSEVRVLGTHFNVNAYNEESDVKTTLVEGSVNIVAGSESRILAPGQQAQLAKGGRLRVMDDANLEETLAWKNGAFQFQRAGIEAVMRQLARWYDVEIVYSVPPSADLFHAEFPRNIPLSMALQALSLTGKVRFEIQGKKVLVSQ